MSPAVIHTEADSERHGGSMEERKRPLNGRVLVAVDDDRSYLILPKPTLAAALLALHSFTPQLYLERLTPDRDHVGNILDSIF